jgi:hypothetical protein
VSTADPDARTLPGAAGGGWTKWFALGVLVLGAALRLYGLGADSLWYDEAASLYLGQHAIAPSAMFDPAVTTEPPVNALATRAWQETVDALFGRPVTDRWNDFLLRLLPCAFGIAAIPLVFVVARRLFGDERAALGAMLLYAISPIQIHYAQELRVYSIYVFLSMIAVWCMHRALEEDRAWQWAGMVLALATLMYSHFFSMWLIFTLNVAFVLLLGRYRRHFWKWTATNAVLMVLIAPMLYRAFVMHAETQQIEIAWYPSPTWKTPLLTFKAFFAGFGPAAWAYWPLFLLALALWGAAFRRYRSHGPALVLIACLTWVPLIGCAWLWGQSNFSFYEHRIFIFSGVAAILGVAAGAATFGRWGYGALALVVLLTIPGLADEYRGRLHPVKMHRIAMWEKVDFRGAAAYLEEHWQPGDRLVYASHFSAYPMYHYFPRDQVRMGWSAADAAQFIRTMGHAPILRAHKLMPVPKEEAVADAARIWFLRTEGVTFEWQPTTERLLGWLREHFDTGAEVRFDGVVLGAFVPR